jgi:hypothetical protein
VEDVIAVHGVNSGIPIPEGLYGALSDTAHAETVGFRSFVKLRDEWDEHGRQAYMPGLNYKLLNAHVHILTGVSVDVMRWYLEFCGATDEECASWIETVEYSERTTLDVHEDLERIEVEEAARKPR